MKKKINIRKSAVLTFLIGVIAGISPFLFMQLLPSMLNPTLSITPPNYNAIIVTGILIGAITCIVFTTSFEKKEPQDIFFYALGIPAILIATVSNMGANFEAEAALDKATAIVTQETKIDIEKVKSSEKLTPPPQRTSFFDSAMGTAWAADSSKPMQIAMGGTNYLIVIGQYQSEKEAWAGYYKVTDTKLRTERYVPKNLSVHKLNRSRFVLSYTISYSGKDANRIRKIMAINDPQFSVKIIRF